MGPNPNPSSYGGPRRSVIDRNFVSLLGRSRRVGIIDIYVAAFGNLTRSASRNGMFMRSVREGRPVFAPLFVRARKERKKKKKAERKKERKGRTKRDREKTRGQMRRTRVSESDRRRGESRSASFSLWFNTDVYSLSRSFNTGTRSKRPICIIIISDILWTWNSTFRVLYWYFIVLWTSLNVNIKFKRPI